MTKELLSQRQLFLISKGNEVTCLKINSNTKNPLDPNDFFFVFQWQLSNYIVQRKHKNII
jgi:hypothetical protein